MEVLLPLTELLPITTKMGRRTEEDSPLSPVKDLWVTTLKHLRQVTVMESLPLEITLDSCKNTNLFPLFPLSPSTYIPEALDHAYFSTPHIPTLPNPSMFS